MLVEKLSGPENSARFDFGQPSWRFPAAIFFGSFARASCNTLAVGLHLEPDYFHQDVEQFGILGLPPFGGGKMLEPVAIVSAIIWR